MAGGGGARSVLYFQWKFIFEGGRDMKPIYSRILLAAMIGGLPMALATPALADPVKTETDTSFEKGTTTTTTCTKEKGTWTCDTETKPGKNQGDVGSEDETTTQGNKKNFSPEPQGVGTEDLGCKPPSSNGKPCD
jgi:hypothetical protein